eukprot:m51a1_g8436 hypothetical protein (308) ;mRNA; f:359568-360750
MARAALLCLLGVAAVASACAAHVGTYDECEFSRMKEPYLNTGYRIKYNVTDCLRSVLEWHNESMSIWTHVAAFLFFIALLVRSQASLLRSEPLASAHRALFLFFCLSIACSMASSVVFHTLRSSSERLYARLSTVDFTLIAVSLVGAQLPQPFYALARRPALRRAYMLALLAAGALAVAYTQVPALTAPAWRVVRTSVFAVVATFNGVVTLHAAALAPKGSRWAVCGPIVRAYAWAVAAVVVYLPRLPERLWPGVFDNTLQSHVLMHLFFFVTQYKLYRHYCRCYRAGRRTAVTGTPAHAKKLKKTN